MKSNNAIVTHEVTLSNSVSVASLELTGFLLHFKVWLNLEQRDAHKKHCALWLVLMQGSSEWLLGRC